MNIILLKGIFPLKKKIVLSKKFGIELDNPCGNDELSYVSHFLKDKIEFKEDKKLLKYFLVSDTKTISHLNYLDASLKSLAKHYDGNPYFDKNFLKNYEKEKAFNYLIKGWVIVRFDDEGFFRELRKEERKMRKRKERGLFILEGTEIGPKREERALNFLSIIDLIFIDKFKGYLRKTIILEEDIRNLSQELFFYIIGLKHGRSIHKEFDYFTIADNIQRIVEFSENIDKLSQEQSEKLLFIGETIRNVNDNWQNSKMQFLMLVSVIEFLLTHNPDTSKFNVEDSIRKQFQLKAGIVINKRTGESLDLLSQRLKTIYDIRSIIAHGDFAKFTKLMSDYKKKDKEFDFFDFVEECFNYVKVIVEGYIFETNFIETLKKL